LTHAVDGGAHRGGITEVLLTHFPSITVHAFEPQEWPHQKLVEAWGANPRVRIYQQAIGDYDGQATFYINRPNQSSLLKTLLPEEMESTGKTQDVTVVRLDTWSQSAGIVPEFIKLDLQGNELQALRGAGGILKNGVKAIVTEVNFQPRYEACSMFHDVGRFLYDQDFRLYRCYDLCGGRNGCWLQGDALFLRRDVFDAIPHVH